MDLPRPVRAARTLLQLNVLLALAASCLTATAAMMVGASPSWSAAIAAFAVVFGVYNFDRLADATPSEGRATPLRSATVRQVRRWLKLSIPAGFVLAVSLAVGRGSAVMLWTVAFPTLGVAYALPLFPGPRIRRLKDIPYLKTFYVAACWSTFVGMGVTFAGAVPDSATGWLAAFLGLRAFVSGALGDARDIEDDADAGVRTLAVALGRIRLFRLSYLLHACAAGLLVLGVATGNLPTLALSLLPPMLIGVGLQVALECHPERSELLLELYDLEWVAYAPAVWLTLRLTL